MATILERNKQLVYGLTKKTQESKLNWTEKGDCSYYSLVGDYSIVVEINRICIMEGEEIVEEVSFEDESVSNLFKLIRRQVRKADIVIDKILVELLGGRSYLKAIERG